MATHDLLSSIQLLDTQVFQCNIQPSENYLQDPTAVNQLQVSHDMQLAFNIEQGLMGVRLYLNVEGFDEQGQALGISGSFGVEHELSCDQLNQLVTEKPDGQYSLDPEFGHLVMNTLYGTTRGVILEKTRGTILGPTLLPVIDPQTLLGQS